MTQVAVVMGSTSDWESMKQTVMLLKELGVSYEKHVISAHRMPVHLQNLLRKRAITTFKLL